ncbi:MAG: hypothetical protein HGA96_00260 [Desulfobulbaceae bacterium]|nr:hypothetical protein [Desulfobulbaceae bacterium]
MEQPGMLFKNTEPIELITKANVPQQWRLVTNHKNLLYMLAAGLIMAPKGFKKKYYRDPLEAFPGWIPLFAGSVTKSVLKVSGSEQSHLRPCIASINLNGLRGRIMVMEGTEGSMRELLFPDELNGRETLLLVPAPLPISWIETVAFQSKTDKNECEADAKSFGNVPLKEFELKVVKKYFTEASNGTWPPSSIDLPDFDIPPDRAFAAGGMIAMLLHMANSGDLAAKTYLLAFNPGLVEIPTVPPMLRELGQWIQTGSVSGIPEVPGQLFWGVVDCVVKCRSSEATTPIDAILTYLEAEEKSELRNEKEKRQLLELVNDLRTLASGYGGGTNSELFERYPKAFSRALLLFILRENCTALLEFKHPKLTEEDFVAAAILFAARDGWLGLPLSLLEGTEIHEYASYIMAALSHRIAKTGVNLGEAPAMPVPFRELFSQSEAGWNKQQLEAALMLVRKSGWTECLRTRIKLGKGAYSLEIDGGGLQIIMPGDVKAVITEVVQDQFFTQLRQSVIPTKIADDVRELLK